MGDDLYDRINKNPASSGPGAIKPVVPGPLPAIAAAPPAANAVQLKSGQDPRIPAWANPGPTTFQVRQDAPRIPLPDFRPAAIGPGHADPRIPEWAKEAAQTVPAGSLSSVAPSPGSSADSLNKFYDSQGFGPHSTESQVDAARGLRDRKIMRGDIGVPGPSIQSPGVGLRSVPVEPGLAPATPAPAVLRSTPAGPPQQSDDVRAALMEQLAAARENHRYAPGGRTRDEIAAAGNRVVDIANSLSQYDAMKARSAQGDKLGQLGAIAGLPKDQQNLMLALSGQDPAQIQAFNGLGSGQQGINPLNFESAGQNNPQLAEAIGILNGPGDLNSKASLFAKVPGIQDPGNPHRQLWDSYMARQSASDPNFLGDIKTNRDMTSPYEYLRNSLFGRPAAETQRDQQFESDLKALGYDPYGHPAMSPDQQRARLGVKPADY